MVAWDRVNREDVVAALKAPVPARRHDQAQWVSSKARPIVVGNIARDEPDLSLDHSCGLVGGVPRLRWRRW